MPRPRRVLSWLGTDSRFWGRKSFFGAPRGSSGGDGDRETPAGKSPGDADGRNSEGGEEPAPSLYW